MPVVPATPEAGESLESWRRMLQDTTRADTLTHEDVQSHLQVYQYCVPKEQSVCKERSTGTLTGEWLIFLSTSCQPPTSCLLFLVCSLAPNPATHTISSPRLSLWEWNSPLHPGDVLFLEVLQYQGDAYEWMEQAPFPSPCSRNPYCPQIEDVSDVKLEETPSQKKRKKKIAPGCWDREGLICSKAGGWRLAKMTLPGMDVKGMSLRKCHSTPPEGSGGGWPFSELGRPLIPGATGPELLQEAGPELAHQQEGRIDLITVLHSQCGLRGGLAEAFLLVCDFSRSPAASRSAPSGSRMCLSMTGLLYLSLPRALQLDF
ncbi:hypothetical protein AAY473_013229 [Plecturocebus cupreus]